MLECLISESNIEPGQRVKIPSNWGDWLGDSFRGRVAYVRNFGRPTGLAADQVVWLVVEEVDFRGSISLNDQHLGYLQLGDPPLKIAVESELRKSNQLRIEVEMPIRSDRGDRQKRAGGLTGSVRLEIEDTAGL